MLKSYAFLTKNWLEKRKIAFYGCGMVLAVFYYVATIWPLCISNIIGHQLNKLWGIDKILLGILVGSLVFIIGAASYDQLKKHNHNRAYFPFQKVVMPVLLLIILSVVFYYKLK